MIEKRDIMGCCLDLLEMRLYQIVARVKNQHRTGMFDDAIRCHTCEGKIEHRFVKKNVLGFTVYITCPRCGWTFEG